MSQTTKINSALRIAIRTALSGSLVLVVAPSSAFADAFQAGNLIVSSTYYAGDASTVTIGQALPGGGTAVGNGTFGQVFTNESVDPSFGVTSPIVLQQMTKSGAVVSQMAVDSTLVTTSFASKSELALNVSTDGKSVSFMGYASPVNKLDVSNSNTSAVVDSTNPVTTVTARAIANVNLSTGNLQVTNVNAYSGNNGRAVVQANGQYYMVGNAGNGSGNGATLSKLSDNTGVQSIAVGSSGNTTAVGVAIGTNGSSTGYQRGFSLAQLPNPATPGQNYAPDKTGKDDNFRGMTVFNNTLYVTKGSGSNGVDTIYQVGATGALANGGVISNAAITVLPGLNAVSEKVSEAAAGPSATPHPFGLWFGDASTMFVGDEGDGVRLNADGTAPANKAHTGGLDEYKLVNGSWTLEQVFQQGLLDQAGSSHGLPWNVFTDGLRNITGQVNANGSFTIFGATSTVSDEQTHDLGADPNEIVSITIGAYSTAANTSFTILSAADAGQRYGGVAITPTDVAAVPVPAAAWLFGSGLIGLTGLARKRKVS
jgi:hypothetical protein